MKTYNEVLLLQLLWRLYVVLLSVNPVDCKMEKVIIAVVVVAPVLSSLIENHCCKSLFWFMTMKNDKVVLVLFQCDQLLLMFVVVIGCGGVFYVVVR
jgi:hypothetical protein